MGIWIFISDNNQLCISSGSFCRAIYEPVILQDSPVIYGVSCCWRIEWEWNLSSYPARKCFQENFGQDNRYLLLCGLTKVCEWYIE